MDSDIVWYDPRTVVDPTESSKNLSPTAVMDGVIATPLSRVGMDLFYNTSVWPFGYIQRALSLERYATFSIRGFVGRLCRLVWGKRSYGGMGATMCEVRCSQDGFESVVASSSVLSTPGFEILTLVMREPLYVSSVDAVVALRIYFYGATEPCHDWADLSGRGLVLQGENCRERVLVCREAVLFTMLLRYGDNGFASLPRDLLKVIAQMIWDTRFDTDWAP